MHAHLTQQGSTMTDGTDLHDADEAVRPDPGTTDPVQKPILHTNGTMPHPHGSAPDARATDGDATDGDATDGDGQHDAEAIQSGEPDAEADTAQDAPVADASDADEAYADEAG